MDVADAGSIERGGKLALGKTRPALCGNRAGIDDQLDFRALEFAKNRSGLCLLVADRVERPCFCSLDFGFGFGFRP